MYSQSTALRPIRQPPPHRPLDHLAGAQQPLSIEHGLPAVTTAPCTPAQAALAQAVRVAEQELADAESSLLRVGRTSPAAGPYLQCVERARSRVCAMRAAWRNTR